MSHHPEPHPDFQAKFTHPVYADPYSEFGIFGSDEAADVFSEWSSRRKDLGPNSTVQQVLSIVQGVSELGVEADPWIIGAGYTLLWLTGQIDKDGKTIVLGALARERDRFPVASVRYAQMMEDLGVKANAEFAEMNPLLREMVDPSYGTIERHDWVAATFLETSSHGFIPDGYINHFDRIVSRMAASPDWQSWWDSQFGEQAQLGLSVNLADNPRIRTKIRREQYLNLTSHDVQLNLTREDLQPPALRPARAREHIVELLAYLIAKRKLRRHPDIPE